MKELTQLDKADLNEALHNAGYFDGQDVVLFSKFSRITPSGHGMFEVMFENKDSETEFTHEFAFLYVWEEGGEYHADF